MTAQVVSLLVLLFFFPIFLSIGIVKYFVDGLPVFFFQKRIGKYGKPFWMIKFRTMTTDAERKKMIVQKQNEADGPVFKMRNDPRFTRLGKFLSHTGLDELPQLFNILHGDMTFIGPRPLPVEEAIKLKPWMRVREQVAPGLISPAIITGNYHKNFIHWMKSDAYYVERKSFGTDMALLVPICAFLIKLVVREFVLALKKITS